jgi:transposase
MATEKKLTAKQREERRLKVRRLLRITDLSQAEITRIVGISRTAVTKWKRRIEQRRRGLAGLKNQTRPGRPPRLTAQEWQGVLSLLKRRCAPIVTAEDKDRGGRQKHGRGFQLIEFQP